MKSNILSFFFLFYLICIPVFSQLQQGDIIIYDELKYEVVGANLIENSNFEDGFTFWTDATSNANILNSEKFKIVENGGVDNSKYLVGITNESGTSTGSIGTGWEIEKGKKYYFSFYIKYEDNNSNAGEEEWSKVSLTNDKTSSNEPLILINKAKVNGNGAWTKNEIIFENSDFDYIVSRFRWLGGRLGFDSFSLHEVKDVVDIESLQLVIGEAESLYESELLGANDLLIAMNSAKDFLASESSEEIITAISSLKYAINEFKLLNASPDNPIDFTEKILNNDFSNNKADGWKGLGTINYNVAEFYQQEFNMYQLIEGLPEGKYQLKVQGFERPTFNDNGLAYNSGEEVISAFFYANSTSYIDRNEAFSSLYKHKYNGAGSYNGYVNNMASAENAFKIGDNYEVIIDNILLNESDLLTIGAASSHTESGYWALFDNFRLEYHGQITENDLRDNLSKYLELAATALDNRMQKSVKDNLLALISQVEELLENEQAGYEELHTQSIEINTAYNSVFESVELYNTLEKVLVEADQVKWTFNETKLQTLEGKLAIAVPLLDDSEATTVQLNKYIDEISDLVYKKIYVPIWMMGNVYNPNNNWSIERSKESRNWIVFWEPGYGEDPSTVSDGEYRVNVDELLRVAEMSFDLYADELKFIERGRSKTDDYKMIIRLRYTRDWEATGSGVDDMIGLLTLTAWSGQVAGHTLAHEVGHCFQYQTHCDNNNNNGWMYGFGPNGEGGNAWWEMCAQWQGFQVYPELQFTDGRFNNYLNTAHKHILHEGPRYDNYFIQDYWVYKQGRDIIGRMWNESVFPEDPVETYKRLANLTQSEFNDEMYEHAARFATWDIPHLIANGTSRISQRPQPKMNKVDDDFWIIDASVCPENYGYNVIKLNVPQGATTVTVNFQGIRRMSGYRNIQATQAGWRYGFVALKHDGTRVYSEMNRALYARPEGTLSFDCPSDVKNLWLVVSGAPSTHWRHPWDDNDVNDEQWPYQVKFNNTNLFGHANVTTDIKAIENQNVLVQVVDSQLTVSNLNVGHLLHIYDIHGRCIEKITTKNEEFTTFLNSGVYILKIYDKNSKLSFEDKIIVL